MVKEVEKGVCKCSMVVEHNQKPFAMVLASF
jgi:hypothetical protein